MQFPFRDLTNQYISLSYVDVVQRYTQGTASYFLDGMGYALGFIPIPSLGQQILTADQPVPFAITASYAMNGGSGGGSSVSSSWASQSRYADTASYAVSYSAITHTLIADRAYSADSADFAETASFALIVGTALTTISASHANMSDGAFRAASAIHAETASFTLFTDFASSAIAADYAETASVAFTAISASWAPSNSGGNSDSASWASASISASHATTADNLNGWNFTNTSSNVNVLSSDVPVVDISTGSYSAAFFDYVALSGSNTRAGIVFGSWVNGLINYTEVSNVDIGDTSKVTMSLALNGGNVQLLANVSDTTPWNIKALGRYL